MKFSPAQLPKEYRDCYVKWTPEEQADFCENRVRGMVDHMFLSTVMLGMDFQPNPHQGLFDCFLQKDPEQTKSLYDLDTQIKKRMILWPRGLFKTSAVVVEIVQLILNYPNIRILILSGASGLAARQLDRVKRVFEQPSEEFQKHYPDFCGKDLGNKSQFTVPNKTMHHLAEPTVAISSARSVKAGQHFDVIFVDDLVNDQNYKNPKALEKCWEDYKDIGPLLQPAGFLIVTGTRYSFGDTYERIQESATAEMAETGKTVWKISIRTCWRDISGKREVLFPQFRTKDGRTEGHTVEFLESERREKGDEFFACQYENNPVGSGLQTFTDELLNRQTLYHLAQIPRGWTFIIGDLSYVGDDRNGALRDKSVFLVCRVAIGGLYILACHSGKWRSSEVAEQVIFLALKYRPDAIWIERFLGWEAYNEVFKLYATKAGVSIPMNEESWLVMDNQPQAKLVRIGAVEGWLSQGKLFMFAGMENFDLIKSQLMKWPKLGRHDDYADCLGLACTAPHGLALERQPKKQTTSLDYIRRFSHPAGIGNNQNESVKQNNGCGSAIVC